MAAQTPSPDLTHTSMAEVIHGVALAIAEAQFELDRSSVATSAAMAGSRGGEDEAFTVPVSDPDDPSGMPLRASMIELGFVPAFYQFVDTVIDMKLSVSLRRSRWEGGRLEVDATPVDAHFSSTYTYAADLASTVHTKLVPIPPPAGLEERISLLVTPRPEVAPPPVLNVRGPAGLIDLNTADSDELQTIEGIGPSIATAILDGRPFESLDDVAALDHVTPRLVEALRSPEPS